ncbi:hypothetical protein Scep_028255 [Stephania cephalantha]|uniref:Uncharacterized protein n=1 Tax=Stephania cephalantha TaxID=152367 RepID=A0AAP0HHY8_9MAGN
MTIYDKIQIVINKFGSCNDEDARVRIIRQLREISNHSSISAIPPPAKLKRKGKLNINIPEAFEKSSSKTKKWSKKSLNMKPEEDDTCTTKTPSGFEYVPSHEEFVCSRKKQRPSVAKIYQTSRASKCVSKVGFTFSIQHD